MFQELHELHGNGIQHFFADSKLFLGSSLVLVSFCVSLRLWLGFLSQEFVVLHPAKMRSVATTILLSLLHHANMCTHCVVYLVIATSK
jgi:hypothetical protein